jgi:hypothetical protein
MHEESFITTAVLTALSLRERVKEAGGGEFPCSLWNVGFHRSYSCPGMYCLALEQLFSSG